VHTNLVYTADDLHGYLTAIRANLFGEGFRYLIVEGADNGGPHRTEMVRRALPEHYPDERELGPELGAEIAEITALRGFHETGLSWQSAARHVRAARRSCSAGSACIACPGSDRAVCGKHGHLSSVLVGGIPYRDHYHGSGT